MTEPRSPFHLPANLPMRLTIITSDGVSQYTQGDQTLFDEISRHPGRTVDGSAYTRGSFDAALIAQGFPAECVTWVCAEHHRHCTRIDTEHTQHTCIWCDV
jgi:hypothetical protein